MQEKERTLWRELLLRWRGSAYLFAVEAIGVTPDPQQAKVLKAVRPGAHISVRSGHGVGKTACLSWIILWFMCCFTDARIPCTAGSKSQLRDVLWPEIAKWIKKLPSILQGSLEWQTERIFWKPVQNTWFAVARTARKENPSALQGFHEKNLLFVIDEAPGVDDSIFQVTEGALTEPGAIAVMTGNPTRLAGEFYRSHHKDRHLWTPFHFSSDDSSLVSPEYAKRIASKYGLDSDVYRVRVLGDFPLAESDTFIPLHLIEEARLMGAEASGVRKWGLDPARFGDDESALVKRHGRVVYYSDGVRKMDTMFVSGWVVKQYNEAKKLHEEPDSINVDVIGLGAGVFDRLNELRLPVVPVNVQEKARDSAEYARTRDELWGLVRDDLKVGLDVGEDEVLAGQLSAVKYTLDSSGKVCIERSEDMKKRGVDSPDRACALCNTYYVSDLLFPGLSEAVQ